MERACKILVWATSTVALTALYGLWIAASGNTGSVQLYIEPKFSGQALVLNNQIYRSQNGDSLYIDLLRFYMSSIQLTGKHGLMYTEPDSYHLIDAEETPSGAILLKNIPAGIYDSLRFNLGTDSLTNVSGAQGGDLDPTKGMYWAWNSGYINVKLEGRSEACKTRNHVFEFHVGGYMPPNQTVRQIVLPLKKVKVRAGTTLVLPIKVDLGRFFERVQLAMTNQVMIPSRQASALADYFVAVFSTAASN